MENKTEIKRYLRHLELKEKEWEGLCLRCGACCGAYDDPCQHLKKIASNEFYCQIYRQRMGTRKSVAGEEFDCVPVKEILHTYWTNDYLCGCKKYLKVPFLRQKK